MLHSRLKRVAEMIKQNLGEILDQDVSDPRIPAFVTVHSVKVTRDLRSAEVFVTFLEDEDDASIAEAVKALNDAATFIRTLLARRIKLRYLPALRFHYNPSTSYALGLERIFREIEPGPGEESEESEESEDEE